MPNTPVRKLVLDAVQAALEVIAKPTYFNTVKRVYLFNKSAANVKEFPSIIIFQGREEMGIDKFGLYTCELSLQLVALVAEGDEDEKVDAVTQILSDMQTALMQDHTLGGVASDIQLTGSDVLVSETNDRVGVVLSVLVVYQQGVTDPSSTAPSP